MPSINLSVIAAPEKRGWVNIPEYPQQERQVFSRRDSSNDPKHSSKSPTDSSTPTTSISIYNPVQSHLEVGRRHTSPNCLYPAAVITIPKITTSGLLTTNPIGMGSVSRGFCTYRARSAMFTSGGMTFETMELMAFMNDQPRAAPETVVELSPLKSAP